MIYGSTTGCQSVSLVCTSSCKYEQKKKKKKKLLGGKSCSQTGECTNCKELDSYMLQAVPRKIQNVYQLPKQQDMHEIKSNNVFVCLFLLPIMPFLPFFFF